MMDSQLKPSKELVEMRKKSFFSLADEFIDEHRLTFANDKDRLAGTLALAEFGERVAREAAAVIENLGRQWTSTVPMDTREALNCKQYQRGILRRFGLSDKEDANG